MPLVISRRWQERTNIITAKGEMLQRDSITKYELSVWQPERYALAVLAERLRSLGLTIDSLAIDTVRPGARELLRYSHELDSVVTYLNKVSDNLSAEVLLKTLAAERYGSPGTARKGLSVVKEYIAGFGIDTSKIVMADGSGLSRYNLLSPATTTKLLESVYKDGRHYDAFLRSLPIAGIDGTLKKRMGGSPAESNLRAKTGTLSTVTALSGYVRTAESELLAFSIMIQHAPNGLAPYRAIQDKIGILLSGLKREEL
jgi:D-alanyl-D-alanine carboxypeptidase/D-alanyl-D-alanine-endopeptidase (penicillin-binding protein 4)